LILLLIGLCAISLHQTVAEDEKVDAVNKEEASDPKAAIPESMGLLSRTHKMWSQ